MQHAMGRWVLLLIPKLKRACSSMLAFQVVLFFSLIMIVGSISNPCHYWVVAFIGRFYLRSEIWDLLSPFAEQHGVLSSSIFLNCMELSAVPSSESSEVRHLRDVLHAPKNNTLDPPSPPTIFTELQKPRGNHQPCWDLHSMSVTAAKVKIAKLILKEIEQ